MDNLEKQLAQALTHKDPPGDFTAKVMARVAGKKNARAARWWEFRWEFLMMPAQRAALAGGLAGLMLIAGGGGVAYRQHQASERRRATAARDQLLVALRVTGTQLNHVSRVLTAAASENQ